MIRTQLNHTTKNKHSSERNHCSPSYYGFDNSSSDSTIAAPPKRTRRAGVIENYQPPSVSVVETKQTTAEQLPVEDNISSLFAELSPPDLRVRTLANQQTPKLDKDVQSLTMHEAENQESYNWNVLIKLWNSWAHSFDFILLIIMITSTYIVIMYSTGDQILICKYF